MLKPSTFGVAIALGLRPERWTLLLCVLFGVLVASTVTVIGPLPVFAYMLVPAVVVRQLAGSVWQLVVLCTILGALGGYTGAVTSVVMSWPMGASTVMGLAGFVLLGYGKKNADVQKIVLGVLLTLGSFFIF